MASAITPFGLRLPPALKTWLKRQSRQNFTSLNAEIIRCVRERMEREMKTASTGAATLAEASPEA